jgi:uncharacterized membrane protein YhaH (DUF805 family)
LLANIAVGLVAVIADGVVVGWSKNAGPFSSFSNLALIYSTICVTAKRLHDTGRSGWMQLLPIGALLAALAAGGLASLTGTDKPFFFIVVTVLGLGVVGVFVLLVAWLGFFKGDQGANRFGEPDSGDRTVTPVAEVFS